MLCMACVANLSMSGAAVYSPYVRARVQHMLHACDENPAVTATSDAHCAACTFPTLSCHMRPYCGVGCGGAITGACPSACLIARSNRTSMRHVAS